MKKLTFLFIALALVNSSCRTLTSTTYIKPKDSFLLGNNEHGEFNVKLKNVSANDLEVYHAPINGGKFSSEIVKPQQSVRVNVEKNTALVIENKFATNATVELLVTGDKGLSMGYKK